MRFIVVNAQKPCFLLGGYPAHKWCYLRSFRPFSSSPRHPDRIPSALLVSPVLSSDAEHRYARAWIEGFKEVDIPKDALEISFSRSSGPGGQHVNKTNSKATIRCDLTGDWIPPFVISPLRKSPHYLHTPPSLLVSSQITRSAPQNQAHALTLIHETIISAARSVIRGETSVEQKKKVQGLIRREEGRRREDKNRIKSKKAARRE